MYAQLPVFKYQTFDRNSLTFADVPIKPPRRRVYNDDAVSIADSVKTATEETEAPPPVEDPPAAEEAAPGEGMKTRVAYVLDHSNVSSSSSR